MRRLHPDAGVFVLETWLTERAGPDELTDADADADFEAADPLLLALLLALPLALPPNTVPAIAPSADLTGRHPPPRMT
ncbi:hypothetical protein OG949_22480 [Streptomyces scopuliridis]|uniref:hypothetical protein n=1 Tax=Streptomyces scopuliridis TaxID=452529 RepID=UPI002DDBC9E3|nr:hypothetical protein [Streptomyces scopuliridis]WSB35343.1 hypothetical protein OG949_22480 [Streptomyces scopuliridis]